MKAKILAPFNDMKYLDALVDAGADEFYMGFYSDDWKQRFGNYSDINRLTLFKETANKYILEDIADITEQIHARGCSLYITFNAPGYHAEEFRLIRHYIEALSRYKVDGIITSIPEMIGMIKENNMKAVASTMCGIQTTDSARWFRDAGMDRVILPREVNSNDIASITQNIPELEYEVFLMRNGCRYSDANCLGLHGGEHGALCYSLRTGSTTFHGRPGSGDFTSRLEQAHLTFCNEFHEFACGQCAIYRFIQMGITAFKIVGRLDHASEIVRDVQLTKKNIETAFHCENEAQYLNTMIPPGDYADYCRYGLSCYYPEVRRG